MRLIDEVIVVLFARLYSIVTKHSFIKYSHSNHLNTLLVWYLNGRFVSGCQMVRHSNGSLKTGLKKPVYGPKCPVFSQVMWVYHLNTRHPYCPVFRWIRYSGVLYSVYNIMLNANSQIYCHKMLLKSLADGKELNFPLRRSETVIVSIIYGELLFLLSIWHNCLASSKLPQCCTNYFIRS